MVKVVLIWFLAFSLSISLFAQNHGECCRKASDLLTIINHYHVQPVRLDTTFSKNLFNDFFLELDPRAELIHAQDLRFATPHKTKLLELIKNNNPVFLKASTQFYKQKLEEYKSWLTTYLSKPLDYSENDFLNIISSLEEIPPTPDVLVKRRKQYLKYAVLEYIYKKSKMNFASADFKSLESQARLSVLQNELTAAEKLLQPKGGLENAVYEVFLKAIAIQYDPHTAYFSTADADEFRTSLSEAGLSFGFDVKENTTGELFVDRIFPAGPAWKSASVNKGDIVLGIKTQDGKQTDFQFRGVEEVKDILNSYELKEAEIIVRKPDGQIKNVALEKQKLEQAENSIQGFVLSGERKIGYVSLPDFYTQWENENNPGCASDMAKELVKLKKEKIEGLIIDLRFNGGGSLPEALDLAGIFIDIGALSITKETGQSPITMKDINKGTVYDGPIVIMVNGFSASASELLTATLQDYNRAIVVGTPTFGKATGQTILPFSTNFSVMPTRMSEAGAVKITTDKIYRVTGKSYQQNGITPHIFLPDFTLAVDEKEKFYRNSLSPDSIIKKTYYTPQQPLPIPVLKEKSNGRIENSELFKKIQELTKLLLSPVALRVKEFAEYKNKINALENLINTTKVENSLFKAQTLTFDSSLLRMDEDRSTENTKLSRDLEGSVYINEVFKILCDYIILNPK